MKTGFATHFMADLYLCQNQLWLTPTVFMDKILELIGGEKISDFQWVFQSVGPNKIRINGDAGEFFILIQVFPGENFLTIDIFSWESKINVKNFNEALIQIFSPQVVAAESKVRAEHLQLEKMDYRPGNSS